MERKNELRYKVIQQMEAEYMKKHKKCGGKYASVSNKRQKIHLNMRELDRRVDELYHQKAHMHEHEDHEEDEEEEHHHHHISIDHFL